MKKSTLHHYIAVSNAFNKLMQPLVELVIHDLESGKIAFIEGFSSKRSIGDPSSIDLPLDFETLSQTVYIKHNFDGKLIKSISIPIKENDKVVGLLCINYDITLFQSLETVSKNLLGTNVFQKPEALFKNDWQDRINQYIHITLNEQGLPFSSLSNKDKKGIIHTLYKEGAFSEKNSADYIAKIMDMSRATIFNYLRTWKEKADGN